MKMKTGIAIFKKAMENIRSDKSLLVDVIECSISFDREGRLAPNADGPILVRFVSYPQRAKNGSGEN